LQQNRRPAQGARTLGQSSKLREARYWPRIHQQSGHEVPTMDARTAQSSASPFASEREADSTPPLARALEMLYAHRGNPSGELARLLTDDPRNVSAHCLRAALIVQSDDVAARAIVAASVAAILALRPDEHDRANRHARAAHAWLAGDAVLALERYGAIVVDWPHDFVALTVAHALDFRLGRRRMLRDRVARVLPAWHASMPGYAGVLAMYAFGLEENGRYRRAERFARRALALDPRHPAAIHTTAHVMEMQGRAREGLAFLDATETSWSDGTGFAIHLAWHRALFQLDSDDTASALATYDTKIATTQAPSMSALADASALLWRLQLRGIDVAARWRVLADRWALQALDGTRPFYPVHAMMAFAAAGDAGPAARLLGGLRAAYPSARACLPPEEALAQPLCEALLAFARSDYAACVELLTKVRDFADRCGGSVAQCDIVHLTLTEAALRARRSTLARALVAERAARKPMSRLNGLLRQRAWRMMPAPA